MAPNIPSHGQLWPEHDGLDFVGRDDSILSRQGWLLNSGPTHYQLGYEELKRGWQRAPDRSGIDDDCVYGQPGASASFRALGHSNVPYITLVSYCKLPALAFTYTCRRRKNILTSGNVVIVGKLQSLTGTLYVLGAETDVAEIAHSRKSQ
ncbi:hypothetical protein CC86DRAFT_83294 [Ophiobolus disseminans]|uniref:Uncharacterized protein n=1 Tax=Ophiobolus disseminans TaxID=1469910 RepID=A0A6A7AGX6_9PLEO|nr:hypothetical protein CC86DRAFT_83294 [Ophiobolus disseminans]